MKRFTLIIIALYFIMDNVQSQTKNILMNYSYMCYSLDLKGGQSGTCFFYKKNSKIYVVSNYHVFTGADTFSGGRKKNDVRSLFIMYTSKKGGINKIEIPIEIENINLAQYFDHMDLWGYLVNTPEDMEVNFINDLIDIQFMDKIPVELFIYGYPSHLQDLITPKGVTYVTHISNDFSNVIPNVDKLPPEWQERAVVALKKIKEQDFIISSGGPGGLSGSPVFGKFVADGKTEYKFYGVIFGYIDDNRCIAIKPNVAIAYLQNDL